MSFLKAEWRKLAIANYEIDPVVLQRWLPYGTELDFWEEKCYVSLVGFMFLNTKLLGIKILFHTHFEEVNLRFYVKRKVGNEWRRGVVFIKEIVPKPALTFVANTVYKENYETMPMTHLWQENENSRVVEYKWRKDNNWQSFKVKTDKEASIIESGSKTEFITEHYWGYAKVNSQSSIEYEVTHPRWLAYHVTDHEINVDFGMVYGSEFSFLNNIQPASVMLAEGSEISVEHKNVIK